jgi:hypothetical protein
VNFPCPLYRNDIITDVSVVLKLASDVHATLYNKTYTITLYKIIKHIQSNLSKLNPFGTE